MIHPRPQAADPALAGDGGVCSAPAPGAVPVRIRHIDSLRAVAAGLVVWTHLGEAFAPGAARETPWFGFLWTLPPALNLGRVGVLLFFAISGFVICRSFGGPREGGGRRFLIKRFCRLYPAFAVSLFGGLLIWWLRGDRLTWQILAANVTMAPQWFGQPFLISVYWTLAIELVFYGLCLGLYRLGWLHRPVVTWSATVILAGLPRWLHAAGLPFGQHFRLPLPASYWAAFLAVMCWGAVFRQVYDDTGGLRRGAFARPGVWLFIGLTVALVVLTNPGAIWGVRTLGNFPWRAHVVMACALVTFAVWVGCLRIDNPVLTFLGVISYSWYLFHLAVLSLLGYVLGSGAGEHLPFPVVFSVGAALSIAVAAAAQRWVERPGVALGKRWARSDPKPEFKPSGGSGPHFAAIGS